MHKLSTYLILCEQNDLLMTLHTTWTEDQTWEQLKIGVGKAL